MLIQSPRTAQLNKGVVQDSPEKSGKSRAENATWAQPRNGGKKRHYIAWPEATTTAVEDVGGCYGNTGVGD
jgi:hypothetical protein